MRPIPIAAVALLVLAASSPAAAEERLLAAGPATDVVAHGATAAWNTDRGWMVRRGEDEWPLPYAKLVSLELGSDFAGRTVAVYTRCRGSYVGSPPNGCVVRAGDLRVKRTRLLYDGAGEYFPFGDLHRGTLALTAGSYGVDRGVYVRRRGEARRALLLDSVGPPSIGAGWVAFELGVSADEYRLEAISADGRRRHTLAIDDTYDNDCRCGSSARAREPLVAGRHAYWLETYTTGAPYTQSVTTRVARADLRQSAPAVEYYDTGRAARSFAVGGARLLYTGFGGEDLYEVVDPAWRKAGSRVPSRT